MLGQLSGRVLLVDHEPLVRKLICGHLVAAGYVVRVAVDGLDAIGKLRAGPPDLIISDLNMPRMSGFELLNVVRKRFPQIPVIVLSVVPPNEMPERVAADAYFHKTEFEFEQLLQTISDLTRNPPQRSAAPHIDNKPAQAKGDTNGHYLIGCDECLRVFSFPRASHTGRDEAWTTCTHCGRVVRYYVKHEDPQVPAQP